MNTIKSLTFTTLVRPHVNPALDRRAKIVARLEEQKLLLNDPNYMRTVRKRVKGDTGEKSVVEKRKRVQPWWMPQPNGSYAFFVRMGWKLIEFEKGKTAIAVSSLEKLPSIIDTLIAAVRNGELDAQLLAATKAMSSKTKKAA